MADGSMVFPDDVQIVKRQIRATQSKPVKRNEANRAMSDNDRVVFPDEVEDTKAKAAEENEGTDTNSIEQPELAGGAQMRNMIISPDNCPPGMKKGADGVCRETF